MGWKNWITSQIIWSRVCCLAQIGRAQPHHALKVHRWKRSYVNPALCRNAWKLFCEECVAVPSMWYIRGRQVRLESYCFVHGSRLSPFVVREWTLEKWGHPMGGVLDMLLKRCSRAYAGLANKHSYMLCDTAPCLKIGGKPGWAVSRLLSDNLCIPCRMRNFSNDCLCP